MHLSLCIVKLVLLGNHQYILAADFLVVGYACACVLQQEMNGLVMYLRLTRNLYVVCLVDGLIHGSQQVLLCDGVGYSQRSAEWCKCDSLVVYRTSGGIDIAFHAIEGEQHFIIFVLLHLQCTYLTCQHHRYSVVDDYFQFAHLVTLPACERFHGVAATHCQCGNACQYYSSKRLFHIHILL